MKKLEFLIWIIIISCIHSSSFGFFLIAEDDRKIPGNFNDITYTEYTEKSYILLLKDLPMYNSIENFDGKIIAYCPSGSIVISEKYAMLNYGLEGKSKKRVHVDLITCKEKSGWMNSDRKFIEETSDRDLLERNKKRIPIARQIGLEIGGSYTKDEINHLSIIKAPNHDYALEFNVNEGAEYIYFENYHRLGKGIWEAIGKEGTVVLTKIGKKLKIVVKKDLNGKLKKFHNKVFDPYQCCGD